MGDFANFDMETGGQSLEGTITINHVFFNNQPVGLGFEELEDNTFGVERVDPDSQSARNQIKVGFILRSINGKAPPKTVDELAKTFSRSMRNKKATMMIGFSEPSLFKRRPSLKVYSYEVNGGHRKKPHNATNHRRRERNRPQEEWPDAAVSKTDEENKKTGQRKENKRK